MTYNEWREEYELDLAVTDRFASERRPVKSVDGDLIPFDDEVDYYDEIADRLRLGTE